MAFTKNTAFEYYQGNISRDNRMNVTGKYGSFSASVFTPADCDAGQICKTQGQLPLEGYAAAGKKNTESFYMVAATNGQSPVGTPNDRTGLYICNPYDVNKATDGIGATFNFPGKTLGIGIPSDERGTFTEIMIGDKFNFGAGNFTTVPTSSLLYATIANGKLTAVAAAPTDGSVYFAVEDYNARFTVGAYDGGAKYTLRALRSVAAGA